MSKVWHDVSEKPVYKEDCEYLNQIAVFGETPVGKGMSVCMMIDEEHIYAPISDKEYKWGDCPFTNWAYVSDLRNIDNQEERKS